MVHEPQCIPGADPGGPPKLLAELEKLSDHEGQSIQIPEKQTSGG
jgi:hypothetical protein